MGVPSQHASVLLPARIERGPREGQGQVLRSPVAERRLPHHLMRTPTIRMRSSNVPALALQCRVLLRCAMEICHWPLALIPLPRYSCWNATHDTGCITLLGFAGLHTDFKH